MIAASQPALSEVQARDTLTRYSRGALLNADPCHQELQTQGTAGSETD